MTILRSRQKIHQIERVLLRLLILVHCSLKFLIYDNYDALNLIDKQFLSE